MSDPFILIIITAVLSACSAVAIPYFQQVKGKEIPDIEYTSVDEIEMKVSKKSSTARWSYIFCCGFLGFIVGVGLALYWLGYGKDMNGYQQMLWALIIGFVTPQLLSFLQKTNLSMLSKKL